jgi:M penetrans paralogue family 26
MTTSNEDPFDDGFVEDPFIDDHFSSGKTNSAYSFQDQSVGQVPLPDASSVLVLGIVSIVGSFCYGIFGIVLAIVALGISGRSGRLLRESPNAYTMSSVSNYKAGRVCAIVGLAISAVYILVIGIVVLLLEGNPF